MADCLENHPSAVVAAQINFPKRSQSCICSVLFLKNGHSYYFTYVLDFL